MTEPKPREITGSGRLEAFSDGVFAIIITIMVLDLRPPEAEGIHALLQLWPVALSYAVSFFVVAIYWLNHHRTFHFVKRVGTAVLWANILLLFCLSLIPFFTAYMGEHRVDALSVALYAGDMFVCGLAALVLRVTMIRENPSDDPAVQAMNRAGARKLVLTLILYVAAVPLAAVSAALALALIFLAAAAYVLPSLGVRARAAAREL
jgi:uncharacterized membrane protein